MPALGTGDVCAALLYRRVSSDDQAREGLSLDTQRARTRRYAARLGWAIGGENADVASGLKTASARVASAPAMRSEL